MAITQKWGGDVNQLLREMERLQRQNAKLDEQVQSLADKSKKGSDQATSGFLQWNQAMEVAGKAMEAVNATIERQIELQEKSLELGRQVATAQADVARNVSGDPVALQRIERAIPGISERAGVADLPALRAAAASAVSAAGAQADPVGAAIAAVGAGARITPDQPANIPLFAGAALDVQQATGVQRPESALGFLLGAGSVARVADPRRQAENIAEVISTGVQTDATGDARRAARQSAALFSAFTTLTGETKGPKAATAAINLGVELQNFFAGRQGDPGDLFGRIAAIQEDPALQQEFGVDLITGVPGAFGVQARRLLTDADSTAAQRLETFLPRIQFSDEAFERTVRAVNEGTPALADAAASRRIEAARARRELVDERQRRRAQNARDTLRAALQQTGGGVFDTVFDLGTRATFETVTALNLIDPVTAAEQGVRAAADFADSPAESQFARDMLAELRGLRDDVRSGSAQQATTAANAQLGAQNEQ